MATGESPTTLTPWTPAPALKIGDVMTMNVRVIPKWWQIWKKPHYERQQCVVKDTGTSNEQ